MAKTEFFDENAEKYDKWFDKEKEIFELELSAIRKFVPKNKTGIEIGVGTGRYAESLGIRIGVEPSSRMGKIAVTKGVDVITGIAESLPVRSESFDLVFINTVLCFLDSPIKSIEESFRILKTGGIIIVGMIDKLGYLGKKYGERKKKNSFYGNASFLSVPEAWRMLSETGFSSPEYLQVLIPGKDGATFSSEIKMGYGKGSYVVIKCKKP